ncbi:hypothetical protein EMQ25_12110 [Arsenicitalea aurantiaca]|uniref:Glucose-methanol-choline oxidoreductase N-terminal domain-containing protein n=1 Tax=Arsenicitalea aurantiaca TaxID=1783274 RepID=A0A433X7N3_9HYPH|nr:GMC family oxidoreductase N-terminal domain-containing protein [Arsenicitalea aurantiaca]RUT30069.1 hypothetical protein EMQ25_12110 [Arsenicitalea aurantiaca]
MRRPDILVIGGGSAGATLAGQLARDTTLQILLVESGGRPMPVVHELPILAGVLSAGNTTVWRDETEPEAGLGGRRLSWPRGRVLGGSSAINGVVWMRGRPSDYDRWQADGAQGWDWASVAPVFDALDGPEGAVGTLLHPASNPLYRAFLAAAREAGHPISQDFNLPPFEGVGRYALNVRNGRRVTSARAFLARPPANLMILTGANVAGLILEGRRVSGARIKYRGRTEDVFAGQTVLSAGAINSPRLLMVSGIGPANVLESAGIPVRAELPGVGQNLQDHICGRISHACPEPVSLRNLTRADRALAAGIEAMVLGRGEASVSPFGAGMLLRASPDAVEPDVQGFMIPGLSDYRLWLPGFGGEGPGHGFTASVYQLRPESRGSIAVRSADPDAPPIIRANYFSDPRDRDVLRLGMEQMALILGQPAMARYLGPRLSKTDPSDRDGFEAALGREAGTAFHPVGTCRIGRADDAMAVVTPDLRVRGLEGLRIADASVMPRITSGNTNAPSMMIGLRGARFITGSGPQAS